MDDLKIKEILIIELEKAEMIWDDVKIGLETKCFSNLSESYTPSSIPGFPLLKNGQGKVGDFVAMVLDIRNSTSHLLEAYNSEKKVSQLQRVYYETTAINTIGLLLVNENNGRITEFLGDGFLALFNAKEDKIVYKSNKCAKECIRIVADIVNPMLKDRYDLPPLKIGIGLAYSKAIITNIGFAKDSFPKAIGECIFRASKLSIGTNEIMYDERIKQFWPKSKGGKISFQEKKHENTKSTKGYIIKMI